MLQPPALLWSSGVPHLDRVLAGLVGATEVVLPAGMVRAYYLKGSFADGTAVAGSDFDLMLVVRRGTRPDAIAAVKRLFFHLSRVSPVPVDVAVCAEDDGVALWASGVGLAKLLYGTPVPPESARPPADLARRAMHVAFDGIRRLYPPDAVLGYPLRPPAPSSPWLGFDRRPVRGPDGGEQPGTGDLVAVVTRAAQALVMRAAGGDPARWVRKKGDAVGIAYRAAFGDDPWAGFVTAAIRRCREDWGYRLPSDPADRAELQGYCRQAMGFVDHFLFVYRTFALAEVAADDPLGRWEALRRLGEVVYPGSEVRAAVEQAARAGGPAGALAAQTLHKMESVTGRNMG